jgi:hypothetical protein
MPHVNDFWRGAMILWSTIVVFSTVYLKYRADIKWPQALAESVLMWTAIALIVAGMATGLDLMIK